MVYGGCGVEWRRLRCGDAWRQWYCLMVVAAVAVYDCGGRRSGGGGVCWLWCYVATVLYSGSSDG